MASLVRFVDFTEVQQPADPAKPSVLAPRSLPRSASRPPSTSSTPPPSVLPAPTSLLPYVFFSPNTLLLWQRNVLFHPSFADTVAQYAETLETLAFPETNLIVKTVKRHLYRS